MREYFGPTPEPLYDYIVSKSKEEGEQKEISGKRMQRKFFLRALESRKALDMAIDMGAKVSYSSRGASVWFPYEHDGAVVLQGLQIANHSRRDDGLHSLEAIFYESKSIPDGQSFTIRHSRRPPVKTHGGMTVALSVLGVAALAGAYALTGKDEVKKKQRVRSYRG